MARKVSEYIEVDGALFDPDVKGLVFDAIALGIDDIGNQTIGIMMGFISAGGFVKTHQLLESVDAKFRRKGGQIGYSLVAPTAVYPEKNRPTRTWLSRGTRRGLKLRAGYNIFTRTATAANRLDFTHQIADRVAKALE
jgi:hypothetical protein